MISIKQKSKSAFLLLQNQDKTQKNQKPLALVPLFEASISTACPTFPTKMPCEIYDDANLFMQNTLSVVIRGHPNLNQAGTETTSMQNHTRI